MELFFEEEAIRDSQLKMMFACCHPTLPAEAQMILILKTLCGLSTTEIAKAFLKDEEAIAKRLYRAKQKLKTEGVELVIPPAGQLSSRLDAVLHSLYLLFNEGYNSATADQLIREDLCEEAMRLTYLLTQCSSTNLPRTNALLALFCFQASRLRARLDDKGNIILLKYQDRSLWYQPLIQQGAYFLERSTQQETSVYHLEAAIAWLHATAKNFEATNWKAIYRLYCILHEHYPNAILALNKAIAASYAESKPAAISQLEEITGLEDYYLYHTAIGEIYFDWGLFLQAEKHYCKALALAPSPAERQLLSRKVAACKEHHLQ